MRLNKKGQTVMLDILVSVVVLILMVFLLFKVSETHIYNSMFVNNTNNLVQDTKLSYDKINFDTNINVNIIDQENTYILQSSIYEISDLSKRNLGLTDYNCSFSIDSVIFTNNECNQTIDENALNIYKIDFNLIYYNNKDMDKDVYQQLRKNNNLEIKEAQLVVWK